LAKRYATLLTAVTLLWIAVLSEAGSAQQASESLGAAYEGIKVESIEIPAVDERDRSHLLALLAQKPGTPLHRDQVRESIRALYATGRFADIQAEVTPSGDGVKLSFVTSANFFVGAVDVEGALSRPTANQIVNASKLQLGELFNQDKLNRAIENVRQLMEENGYHRARVTAEDVSNLSTQQVDVLFHVAAGSQAHVGEVKVSGTSNLTADEVKRLANMQPGDRVTASRVSGSLQRLRKRFQKQNRALAQVSIAEQIYHPETNALDFTYQIDPGPIVLISAEGYRISKGTLKREIPVYEENAVDDDLLSEGRRNLLDYLQTRGRFDAKVEISGNKNFLDTAKLRSYLQIQPAHRLLTHGKYSDALLKSDVATLQNLYRSNGFHQVEIKTKVDDNYQGSPNKLAVHIDIEEGARTRAGEVRVLGNEKVKTSDLPELSTQSGQPYSQQELANDRERILGYYFDHGFPNASLEINTKTSSSKPNREDVTFTIQEGERFTVDQVMVSGTEHTRDYVVQRELQVEPADPLSQLDLLNTQTRLYNLGIFSQWIRRCRTRRGATRRRMFWSRYAKPSVTPSLMARGLNSRLVSRRERLLPRAQPE
jgi:outer membrane protein insertion porin family